jgi:cellulose synthase/poly-beta-1,6-N-acetylglucosamine synthase-like glycosyltransferase
MAALLVLAACAVVLSYVFVGYPWALRAIVRVRGPRRVNAAPITPRVTLVISAFNEAAVIRRKIENALELDYPPDLLDVAVISDASHDGTDEIVESFPPDRVSLRRQRERRGKTAGLNNEVPALAGEIIVFSDANAIYRADAIRNLVRNFADPEVGCVTGEARYVEGTGTTADAGEHAYWDYEMGLKRLETAVGSMVGGDGAIYAIRKHLWQPLPESAINDFLNPLQIVAAGWRNVYEPEAVAFEETAGDKIGF